MDVCKTICIDIDEDYVNDNLGLLTESTYNHGVYEHQDLKVLKPYIVEVTDLLKKRDTRTRAVSLLPALIQQCPKHILTEHGQPWVAFCSMIVISSQSVRAKVDACRAITSILRKLPSLPELRRGLLGHSFIPLITSLAEASTTWSEAAFECLLECLEAFPAQCLPGKDAIEKAILKQLDAPLVRGGQYSPVDQAAQVFAALPLPGTGGKDSNARAEAKGRQLTQLLSLAHYIMDYLFEGVVEKESYDQPRQHSLNLPPLVSPKNNNRSPLNMRVLATTRLVNTFKFISGMVTCRANDAVCLKPHQLLGPVFRLLQMDLSVLQSYKSQEHKHLLFFLPTLHQHCLIMLRNFIISIGDSIDLFFGLIGEVLASVIKSSGVRGGQAWATAGHQTKIVAYAVMTTLVEVSHGRHPVPEKLARQILEDITLKSHEFTLQKGGLNNLNMQKKKSNKGYTVTTKDSEATLEPLPDFEQFGRLMTAALGLTQALFSHGVQSTPLLARQLLQRSLLTLADTYVSSSTPSQLFANEMTRTQLFKALTSMATHPDPRSPVPYTLVVGLLQAGVHDRSMKVVSACQTGLACVSFITSNPQISLLTQVFEQHRSELEDQMIAEREEEEEEEEEVNKEEEVKEDVISSKKEEEEKDEVADVPEKENESKVPQSEESKENDVNGESDAIEVVDIDDEASSEEDSGGEVEVVEIKTSEDVIEITEVDTKEEKEKGAKSPLKEGIDKSPLKEGINKSPMKRDASDNAEIGTKKRKTDVGEVAKEGPSLDEMLASFIDADPEDPQ